MKVLSLNISTTPRASGETWAIYEGVAVVEIQGKTREVRAVQHWQDGALRSTDLYGLAVRVGRSGVKVWEGSAILWPNGNINNVRAKHLDRMNQRGIQLLGFFEDAPEAARSKR